MERPAVPSFSCLCRRSPLSSSSFAFGRLRILKPAMASKTKYCSYLPHFGRIRVYASKTDNLSADSSNTKHVKGADATQNNQEEEDEKRRSGNNLSRKADDLFSVTSSSHFDVDYLGESTKGDMNLKQPHRFETGFDHSGRRGWKARRCPGLQRQIRAQGPKDERKIQHQVIKCNLNSRSSSRIQLHEDNLIRFTNATNFNQICNLKTQVQIQACQFRPSYEESLREWRRSGR